MTLSTQIVPIDPDCTGELWKASDEPKLARLIAIMAMGQAALAGHIISTLEPAAPAFSDAQLRQEAKIKLTLEDKPKTPRGGYPRWQRDGLIFEAISWLAAVQMYPGVLLKLPHVSSTTQGLDGLMIELMDDKSGIKSTTIFEDKCTTNPRSKFTGEVIPAFKKRHQNERSAEVISAATTLLMTAGIDDVTATRFAAAVTDNAKRKYRASFAVTTDSHSERKKLFADYNKISGIAQHQRIGACLCVPQDMRNWFENLAKQAIKYLDELDGATS